MINIDLVKQLDSCRLAIAEVIAKHIGSWDLAKPFDASEVLKMLERPKEFSMGDFAFPCFRFAKERRLPPPKIAQELGEMIQGEGLDWIKKIDIQGAFCNVFIDSNKFACEVFPVVVSGKHFQIPADVLGTREKKMMVEFSQPNTHKEFHVGHGRNFCLGDCVVRLYRYMGFPVIAANYPGDEGTHIAKCLWYIQSSGQTSPQSDQGEWLGKMYVEATLHLESLDEAEKKKAEQEVSEVLAAIESKNGPLFELWQETREWSLELFRKIYAYMDVQFDKYFYESEVSEESQKLVDDYLSKGVFVEDDGAVGIDLKDDKLGFMLVRKRDGNTLYATKDLVLAQRKFAEFDVDLSVYVVGSEQDHHFKQVFKTLERMGFEKAKDCYHLSYGMVTLPEGKMSSRKGNTIPFSKLDQEMTSGLSEVLEKYRGDWSDEEISECGQRLAVGAIRYGMLATDPVKDVVFNLSDWLSFEGHSGPYLMYSYARTRSIVTKAKDQGITATARDFATLEGDEVRELCKFVQDFNVVVAQSSAQYKPSILCHFLYEGCRSFNRFYNQYSVLKADTAEQAADRLALVEVFAQTLKHGLSLLGIRPPDRM